MEFHANLEKLLNSKNIPCKFIISKESAIAADFYFVTFIPEFSKSLLQTLNYNMGKKCIFRIYYTSANVDYYVGIKNVELVQMNFFSETAAGSLAAYFSLYLKSVYFDPEIGILYDDVIKILGFMKKQKMDLCVSIKICDDESARCHILPFAAANSFISTKPVSAEDIIKFIKDIDGGMYRVSDYNSFFINCFLMNQTSKICAIANYNSLISLHYLFFKNPVKSALGELEKIFGKNPNILNYIDEQLYITKPHQFSLDERFFKYWMFLCKRNYDEYRSCCNYLSELRNFGTLFLVEPRCSKSATKIVISINSQHRADLYFEVAEPIQGIHLNIIYKFLEKKIPNLLIFQTGYTHPNFPQEIRNFEFENSMQIISADFAKINGAPNFIKWIPGIWQRMATNGIFCYRKGNNFNYKSNDKSAIYATMEIDVINWKNDGLNNISRIPHKIEKIANNRFRIEIGNFNTELRSPRLVLIVVPYANFHQEQKRPAQLKKYIENIKRMLIPGVRVLIAEQISPKIFNGGLLRNCGVAYFSKFAKPETVIFNDIDMLPDEELFSKYLSIETGTCLLPISKEYQFKKIPLGGAISGLPYKEFVKINGFPNNFWGWGGEDNCFQMRYKNILAKSVKQNTFGKASHLDEFIINKQDYITKNNLRVPNLTALMDRDLQNWSYNGVKQAEYGIAGKPESQDAEIIHVKFKFKN